MFWRGTGAVVIALLALTSCGGADDVDESSATTERRPTSESTTTAEGTTTTTELVEPDTSWMDDLHPEDDPSLCAAFRWVRALGDPAATATRYGFSPGDSDQFDVGQRLGTLSAAWTTVGRWLPDDGQADADLIANHLTDTSLVLVASPSAQAFVDADPLPTASAAERARARLATVAEARCQLGLDIPEDDDVPDRRIIEQNQPLALDVPAGLTEWDAYLASVARLADPELRTVIPVDATRDDLVELTDGKATIGWALFDDFQLAQLPQPVRDPDEEPSRIHWTGSVLRFWAPSVDEACETAFRLGEAPLPCPEPQEIPPASDQDLTDDCPALDSALAGEDVVAKVCADDLAVVLIQDGSTQRLAFWPQRDGWWVPSYEPMSIDELEEAEDFNIESALTYLIGTAPPRAHDACVALVADLPDLEGQCRSLPMPDDLSMPPPG